MIKGLIMWLVLDLRWTWEDEVGNWVWDECNEGQGGEESVRWIYLVQITGSRQYLETMTQEKRYERTGVTHHDDTDTVHIILQLCDASEVFLSTTRQQAWWKMENDANTTAMCIIYNVFNCTEISAQFVLLLMYCVTVDVLTSAVE